LLFITYGVGRYCQLSSVFFLRQSRMSPKIELEAKEGCFHRDV
jgi:hypothetical protein